MPRISEIQIRDPFILSHDNMLYLYGSTDKNIWKAPASGFEVYRSSGDLKNFDGPYPAFTPKEDFWSNENFWAPEVYFYKGGFYMFATFKPKDGRRGTAVLRSESPLGPFVPWSSGPVTDARWECLDGSLYIEDGKPWMIFCHEWQQVHDGEICAVPLTEDLRQADGEPTLLFCASEARWSKPLPKRAGENYVTDGPFMYKTSGGDLLMLWSSFGETGNYCIGTARSDNGKLSGRWIQSKMPIYEADGGHGMLFKIGGKLYLAIHTPNTTPDERPIFVAMEEFEGGIRPVAEIIS